MTRLFLLLISALITVAGALFLAFVLWPLQPPTSTIPPSGDVARGAYLARMAGCIACHTNASAGGAPLAGGLALKTDFGTFYSANLTTDEEFGIGNWTVEQFAAAVRAGISPGGRPYYPAFPYPFYAKFSEQDIADLWAAFRTVRPVSLPSRQPHLSFPYNFRPGLKLWRGLFLDSKPFEINAEKSAGWNRGKFIVTGPGHCGACHTPRNFAGARQVAQRFRGADGLPGGGRSPSITAAGLQEAGWTMESLKYALKTGILPDGDIFGGSMGEVVRDGTSFMSNEDLTAIATYLLDKEQ